MGKGVKLGPLGEELAARFLKRKGYKILERNYRCPFGEVDIVALHRGTLVFVEVKTRKSLAFGHPAEAVDLRKQRRLQRIASCYLGQRRLGDIPVRFDVVALSLGENREFDLIQNAFSPEPL